VPAPAESGVFAGKPGDISRFAAALRRYRAPTAARNVGRSSGARDGNGALS
jgi:hypothetical protein